MTSIQRWSATALLVCLLTACSGGPAELLDTAQFEERQFNTAHAMELYQELLDRHPNSDQAAVARERLKALKAESP